VEGVKMETAKVSEYVGTVKQRVTKTVTLSFVTGWDTAFGYTTLLKFVTDAGEVLVWKASRTNLGRFDMGKRYLLTGTVKAHTEYRGVKQTQVLRCKLVEVHPGEPEVTTLEAIEPKVEWDAERYAGFFKGHTAA
jgi:hypothetical protein